MTPISIKYYLNDILMIANTDLLENLEVTAEMFSTLQARLHTASHRGHHIDFLIGKINNEIALEIEKALRPINERFDQKYTFATDEVIFNVSVDDSDNRLKSALTDLIVYGVLSHWFISKNFTPLVEKYTTLFHTGLAKLSALAHRIWHENQVARFYSR